MLTTILTRVYAQESTNPEYSFSADFNYSVLDNKVFFSTVPGIPNCCPGFTSGEGNRLGFTLNAKKFFTENLYFGPGLGLGLSNTKFASRESTFVYYKGQIVNGNFEHTVEIDQTQAFIQFGGGVLISGFDFYAGIGSNFNLNSTLYQQEEIVEPANAGTFIDEFGQDTGSRTRNEFEGNFEYINDYFVSLNLILAYEMKLNNRGSLKLRPAVSYGLSLNKVSDLINWDMASYSLGLGLSFSTYKKPPELIELLPEFTIPENSLSGRNHNKFPVREFIPETGTLDIVKTEIFGPEFEFVYDTLTTEIESRKVVKINKADTTDISSNTTLSLIPESRIMAGRINSRVAFPILSYVFFNGNETAVPPRYFRQSGAFSYLQNYYGIFGYVASKALSADTEINLKALYGIEGIDKETALARLDTIKGILSGIYNVPADNIYTETERIHQAPSEISLNYTEEHNRVEITLEDSEFLAPISFERDEFTFFRDEIRFKLNQDNSLKYNRWTFELNYEGVKIHESSGSFPAPSNIVWLTRDLPYYKDSASIEYKLLLKSQSGEEFIYTNSAPVYFKNIQSEATDFEKYYIILFDYDSAELSSYNLNLINKIKESTSPQDKILIRGFTDKTGDPEYNLHLSKIRAQAVARQLGRGDVEIIGMGSRIELYDNQYPEGRFYSRTVEIRILQK
ncbi:MAG: OmpA family protein [Candidatus Kapaibacterium sp.]